MRRLIAAAAMAGALMAMSGGAAQACIDCGKASTGPTDGAGVTSQGGGTTYLSLMIPRDRTLVQALGGDTVIRWKMLRGRYGEPTIAGATPEGLSFDGTRLVLERFATAFPKRTSGFVVLRTKSLRVERTIELRGDFTYDALSPDGRMMYLIEHPLPNSQATYRVRAFDVQTGHLLSKPVADPWEGPRMSGYAVARVMSGDGVWAYTLYQQNGRKMFVHALDTAHGKAHCVDLPPIALNSTGITLDGRTLTVWLDAQPTATVDTATFSARVWNATPEPPKPATPAGAAKAAGSGRHSWALTVGLAAVVLLAAAGAFLAVRRRAATPQAG
jgi:hypothetical protein